MRTAAPGRLSLATSFTRLPPWPGCLDARRHFNARMVPRSLAMRVSRGVHGATNTPGAQRSERRCPGGCAMKIVRSELEQSVTREDFIPECPRLSSRARELGKCTKWLGDVKPEFDCRYTEKGWLPADGLSVLYGAGGRERPSSPSTSPCTSPREQPGMDAGPVRAGSLHRHRGRAASKTG